MEKRLRRWGGLLVLQKSSRVEVFGREARSAKIGYMRRYSEPQ